MIYILDDENYLKELIEKTFPNEQIFLYRDSLSLLKAIQKRKPDLLVLDLRIERAKHIPPENYISSNPAMEGILLLEKIRRANIDTPTVLATRFAVSEIFMRAYALNAFPIEVTDFDVASRSLKEKVGHFLEKRPNKELINNYRKLGFAIEDPQTLGILKLAERLKDTDDTILITGETGVGKDTLARAIHQRSRRANEPLMNFVISAYPQNLLYSKLFGTTRNAYTGATDQSGCFEEVENGTLMLNEIGDLDLESQIQLLQVLESRKFSRLGENKKRTFKGRIIALTNKNLTELVSKNLFREDLYNRLRKFHIHIPPLRERRMDIRAFIKFYLPEIQLSNTAKQFMLDEFVYPGNLRTLKFILDRVKKLSPTYPHVSLDDVISAILDLNQFNETHIEKDSPISITEIFDFLLKNKLSFEELNKLIFKEALYRFGPHWSESTWGKLGISRATFYRKLKQHHENKTLQH